MTPQELLAQIEAAAEALVTEALDNEQGAVPFAAVEAAAGEIGAHPSALVRKVQQYGINVAERAVPKAVRGYTSNPNNRWAACPSHGGSGWEVISGFAGREG